MWGSNVPVTRTPDAHWMAEARYRGQKVVVVAPDYADNAKFADEWLHPHPGTDAALAIAMGHVILKEHFVDNHNEFFDSYVKQFTDLPFLVTLPSTTRAATTSPTSSSAPQTSNGTHATGTDADAAETEGAAWKTVVLDAATGRPVVPNGSLGFRWTEIGKGRWNLDLRGVEPRLSLLGLPEAVGAEVLLPRFDTEGGPHGQGRGEIHTRGVPAVRLHPGGPLVTTVFDLLLAQYGVARADLPGIWPTGYDDAAAPGTPAWAEARPPSRPAWR